MTNVNYGVSVDVGACTRRGVMVTTTGDANSGAVSEHAFGLILAAARLITLADAQVKSGVWNRGRYVGIELSGKILGLVGLGRIGVRMSRHAQGFFMTTIAHDPYVRPRDAQALGVTLCDLETLLRTADLVSLHLPLTEETRGLIGRDELALMKPSAILVNTARGGLVDEDALCEALRSRQIAAAALDAFAQEPLPAGHPLTELDNVVLAPHIGGQTQESLVRLSARATDNVLRVLRGETPSDIVNPEALSR